MKKLLLSLALAFNACVATPALAADRIVEGTSFPGLSYYKNFVKNPEFEKNKNDITDASTIASRSTGTPLQGVASLVIDATAATQVVKFDTNALDLFAKGQNCEAKFVYSGNALLYIAYIEQGVTKVTADLVLANITDSQDVSIPFTCGDLSSNSHLVIEATGNGAAIKVDKVYLGGTTIPAPTPASVRITGEMIQYAGVTAPSGWVNANGLTIGSAGSGATSRANADTQALFTLLWTDWSDVWLPIYTSAGALSTRGGSAAADFAANKRMTVPNYKGIFPRGINSQSFGGVTYDGSIMGTVLQDQFQGHRHNPTTALQDSTARFPTDNGGVFALGRSDLFGIGDPITDGTFGTPRTGAETRPTSRTINFIMKL